MREPIYLVDILQERVKKGIVYFLLHTMLCAILLLTLGCLDNMSIFFDSLKYRISVFYIRENLELVYILQKRVE